jgi:tetratricopeptide (TPR) repeat protein
MSEEGNAFSPQLPESFEYSAELYKPHREFRAGLEKIATHIVGGGAPMTFALYGDWGTGKSTALAYLQGLIRERDQKVTFSWWQVPLWARYQDERSALALQILRGVERGIPAVVADMLAGLLNINLGVAGGQSQPENYELAASLALLNVLGSIPNAPPVVEEWILRYITRSGSIRHVVMLDDLDRCDTEFVARLLRATNHWTMEIDQRNERSGDRRPSIYFVLACREDFLLNSQSQGEVKNPRQSLEKYVHVSVNIPRLLNRPSDAANYLHMLVTRLSGLPLSARERLVSMIDSSAERYPDGLFAPLLRVAGDSATPRAIKTRLNLALTEIDYERLDDETLVKEWIIKAFWPDFWTNQYRVLLTRQQSQPEYEGIGPQQPSGVRMKSQLSDTLADRFGPIGIVGQRLKGLLDMSDEALAEALTHIGGEVRADLTDVKPQLAIYLACEPAWPTQTPRVGNVFQPDGLFKSGASNERRRSNLVQAERRLQVSSSLLPQDTHQSDTPQQDAHHSDTPQQDPDLSSSEKTEIPTEPDDQIFYFYLIADAAEDRDDYETAEESLNRLLEVARWVGSGTQRGATIGNAALIAGRIGLLETAFELHKLARAAAPNHFNIMQNYIEFVLDQEIISAYPEVQRLYQTLTTDGKDHKPFRTLIIGLRFLGLTKQPIPDIAERTETILFRLSQEPKTSELMEIMKIPPDVIGYDTVRSACRIVAEHSTDREVIVATLLLMVTVMGSSNNHAHEREVVDAMRWQIKVGIPCSAGDELYANFLHNLGLQLGSLDYRSAATLLYAEAYRLGPQDPDYRRTLSISLERMGRTEDATAVLLGRSINLKDIQPEELPVLLSEPDRTDRWWERLEIPKGEPCPTVLPWLIPELPGAAAGEDHS